MVLIDNNKLFIKDFAMVFLSSILGEAEKGQSGERPKGPKAKGEKGQRTIGQIKTKRPNTIA